MRTGYYMRLVNHRPVPVPIIHYMLIKNIFFNSGEKKQDTLFAIAIKASLHFSFVLSLVCCSVHLVTR